MVRHGLPIPAEVAARVRSGAKAVVARLVPTLTRAVSSPQGAVPLRILLHLVVHVPPSPREDLPALDLLHFLRGRVALGIEEDEFRDLRFRRLTGAVAIATSRDRLLAGIQGSTTAPQVAAGDGAALKIQITRVHLRQSRSALGRRHHAAACARALHARSHAGPRRHTAPRWRSLASHDAAP